MFGWSYFLPIHCSRKRQHDWLTDSQHPLRFQEWGSAFPNVMNINMLSNALVNTRRHHVKSVQLRAGLIKSLKPCAETLDCEDDLQLTTRVYPYTISFRKFYNITPKQFKSHAI